LVDGFVVCKRQNMDHMKGEFMGASRLSLLGLMRVTEYGVIAEVGRWEVVLT
jgi:hypothetical protein